MKLKVVHFLGPIIILNTVYAYSPSLEEMLKKNSVIIINNNMGQNQGQHADAVSRSDSDVFFRNTVDVTSFQNHLIEKIKQGISDIEQGATALTYAASNNKYKLICATLLALYTYICWYLYCINHYDLQHERWSSWRSDLDLEQLLTLDQTQLGHDIMMAIEMRYMDNTNPNDFFTPIAHFSHDVDQEIAQLNTYESIISWITYLPIQRILLIKATNNNDIKQRKQRLMYLKNICKQWVIHYNLEKQPLQHVIKKQILKSYIHNVSPAHSLPYWSIERILILLTIATASTGVTVASYCYWLYHLPIHYFKRAESYYDSIHMQGTHIVSKCSAYYTYCKSAITIILKKIGY